MQNVVFRERNNMEIRFVVNKDGTGCLTAEQNYVEVIINQYNLISSDELILQTLVHNLLKMKVFKIVTSIFVVKCKIAFYNKCVAVRNMTLLCVKR